MATTITGSGVDNIIDGTITNADINASAAIAGSKLSGLSNDYPDNASDDSWHHALLTTINYVNASVLDFNSPEHTGSNITESGGEFTVANAGLYLISCKVANYAFAAQSMDWKLQVNNTTRHNTRLYFASATEISYISSTGCWFVKLNSGDTVRMYGSGYLRGSSDMTQFCGGKVGEL